ncbi:hypothetical protein [Streptomyces sp. SM1]|uniref:hypothetical protein n=1 Tax=Streptomyces sp. SM1 TaxID=402229 RepID=UPI0021561BCC|nr:hypothetical protein [Streptomyces sp. SM1]
MIDVRAITTRALASGALRHPAIQVAAFCLLPLVLLLVDLVAGQDVRLGPLMVAGPTFAAIFCTPVCVLVVLAVAFPCAVTAAAANQQTDTRRTSRSRSSPCR